MNLYIIVEGRRTEKYVYPRWIDFLIPEIKRVQFSDQIINKNYYLFNGGGFPSLLDKHLRNSIEEVNDLGNINYLILIYDVDELTFSQRIEEVHKFISINELKLNNTELVLIPQNRCFETWFLGNTNVFKKNPQDPILVQYTQYYDVSKKDPELMPKFSFNTHAQFHSDYCTRFLRERKIAYSKNQPYGVVKEHFLKALIERNEKTTHIPSFEKMYTFFQKIRQEILNS